MFALPLFNTEHCDESCFVMSSATRVCARLLEVRSRLYELMSHCIPPDVIMRVTASLPALINCLSVEK